MPEQLPLPLDYAQSKELRQGLKVAVADVVQAFIARHVVKDAAGTVIGGPDPRVVAREVGFHLARITSSDYEISIFDTQVMDTKLARLEQLERELTTPATPDLRAPPPRPAAKQPPPPARRARTAR